MRRRSVLAAALAGLAALFVRGGAQAQGPQGPAASGGGDGRGTGAGAGDLSGGGGGAGVGE